MKDFFISFNKADREWASWITKTLNDAKYTTVFQLWDFRPGGNFVFEMDKALKETERVLAVISKDYLTALFTQPEWAAAFARDPTGEKRTLLPVRIAPCELPPLLSQIIYFDLIDLDEEAARQALLDAVAPDGPVHRTAPFPGKKSAFPGPEQTKPASADGTRVAAATLQSIFETSWATFIAQNRLRNQLVARMRDRLNFRERMEYEPFFDRFFDAMDDEERRVHRTIRGYTESVMLEYNRRALAVVEEHPELRNVLPSYSDLKQHLIIWLNKFERVFRNTPSMCLLYVGVEEKMPFPRDINAELQRYLAM